MKKVLMNFIFLLVFGGVFFFAYKNFSKKEQISLRDIKSVEGEVLSVAKKSLKIKFVSSELIEGQEVERQLEAEYFFNENTVFYEQTGDLKTEEEFRIEEREYLAWDKLDIEDKSEKGYKFPADWRINKKISYSDLNLGDKLKIIYFKKDLRDYILIAVKKQKPLEQSVLIDKGRQVNFFAEILEQDNNRLKIRINDNLSAKVFAGAEYEIDLSGLDEFEISRIKSEEEFRDEEKSYQESRLKIEAAGGDFSNLIPPSWYAYEKIPKEDFKIKKGDLIRVLSFISADGIISPLSIQKIIK